MTTPHKWAKEIKAWADGFEIEVKINDAWEIVKTPQWTKFNEYRIKTRHQAVKDAFEAGLEIESYEKFSGKWFNISRPEWNELFEYRIKK
jgi:hypothetical protein